MLEKFHKSPQKITDRLETMKKEISPTIYLKKLLYHIFSHCPKSDCKIRRKAFLHMLSIIGVLHQVSTVRVLKACLCVHILKNVYMRIKEDILTLLNPSGKQIKCL